eukprot:symbB.v1.2.036029.t1/scaffold4988.1/size32064/7
MMLEAHWHAGGHQRELTLHVQPREAQTPCVQVGGAICLVHEQTKQVEAVDLEPVFLLDLDGRITQWNAAAKALLNCGEAG